jgi:hypothetical protein
MLTFGAGLSSGATGFGDTGVKSAGDVEVAAGFLSSCANGSTIVFREFEKL